MSQQPNKTPDSSSTDDFRREAEAPRVSLVREFWEFLKDNKKWWLLPIIITTVGIGLLIVWSYSVGASSFLYPFF